MIIMMIKSRAEFPGKITIFWSDFGHSADAQMTRFKYLRFKSKMEKC